MKNEILWEPLGVAIDLLVKARGSHAIDRSKVRVEEHALASNANNARDDVSRNDVGRSTHRIDPASRADAVESANCTRITRNVPAGTQKTRIRSQLNNHQRNRDKEIGHNLRCNSLLDSEYTVEGQKAIPINVIQIQLSKTLVLGIFDAYCDCLNYRRQ